MPSHFLPFTPKGKDIEVKAIGIKEAHGLGPYDLVDPDALAVLMGVVIIPEAWYDRLDADLRDQVLVAHGQTWSAGSLCVEGTTHILLNPGHSRERRSASLSEELVHLGLGHPKSQLLTVDGVPMRTCSHEIESEAYAVASALLMPYRSTFNHLQAGGTVASIPAVVPVSAEARVYRTKTSGLWKMARSRGLV